MKRLDLHDANVFRFTVILIFCMFLGAGCHRFKKKIRFYSVNIERSDKI